MAKEINKKENQPTPKKIRRKIKYRVLDLIREFKELSEGVNISLKQSLRSTSLKRIKLYIRRISEFSEDSNIEMLLKDIGRLRHMYVTLIFRTGYVKDEEIQRKLDKIPLALAEIIIEYKKLINDRYEN